MGSKCGLERKCFRLNQWGPEGETWFGITELSPRLPYLCPSVALRYVDSSLRSAVSNTTVAGRAIPEETMGIRDLHCPAYLANLNNLILLKDWVILFIHPGLPLSGLTFFPDALKNLRFPFLDLHGTAPPSPSPDHPWNSLSSTGAPFGRQPTPLPSGSFIFLPLPPFQNKPGLQACLSFSPSAPSPFLSFFLIL